MLSPISRSLGVVAGGLALSASLGVSAQDVDVDSFISTERPIALQGALNNIGPDGSEASGAIAGLVVASPSKANPDCEFFITKYQASSANDGCRLLYLDSRLSFNVENDRGRVHPRK